MKKNKLSLFNSKTKDLNNALIKQILNLKKSHYKYSLKSQKIWFKKNVNDDDIHLILTVNKKVIGYNLLRKKKCKIKFRKNEILSSLLIFDTLLINNRFRNKGLSKKIMIKSNHIINQNKKLSVLVCHKKLIKFYEKFNWKKAHKNIVEYANLRKNKYAMFYGNKFIKKEIKKLIIL
tara:strand:+ start:338 stop:868 length:531 start_codon:yes stop_codon:yes gene_type:complete